MKIVCFSINPIFPDQVTGGASKHLLNLCQHLAKHGHDVVVLATEASTGQNCFWLGKRIEVKPILPFHQPFPQPYLVSPGDLAVICEKIAAELEGADRFYIHDGELLLPFLYTVIPTIVSFRDNYYPESILGSFLSQADEIIAVSDFSANVLKATAGRVSPDLIPRIHTVLNGIDTELFHTVDPGKIQALFGINPLVNQVILHPHRPEAGKGLLETIQVTERLVKDYGFDQIRVLVPQWLGEMNGAAEDEFQAAVQAELRIRNLEKHFIFHPWLSQEHMPIYYSAGSLTLSLGNLVEAFGNVAYESLACGTPSIVARTGAHRTQLPDSLIDKVDYGDTDTVAELAAEILHNHSRIEGEKLTKILGHFPLSEQMRAYEEIIVNAYKKPSPLSHPIKISEETRFDLAPWCCSSKYGIYHDYRAKYFQDEALGRILEKATSGISLDLVLQMGANWTDLLNWYHQGILLPSPTSG
ncbi:MAG: glycosyltransferase family 4 protein [Anaerolineaceae bacterium]